MSALIKACNAGLTIKNSASECNESMGPTAMLFAVPPTLTWTANDLLTFDTFLLNHIHAAKGARVYPLFGPAAPIRKITNNKESDVIFTADDGTQIFIRYGVLNRSFGTTQGGLCFAQAVQSLTKAGYSFLEVDNSNQVLMARNADGTFRGMKTTFMYAPSIDLADFKNPAFINFALSVTPSEYIGNGEIFVAPDNNIINLVGLLNTDVVDATGSSTTKLKVGVVTDCAGTDLVALLGSALAVISNFVVTATVAGTPVTITAAAVVAGHIELTGAFTSGTKYTVALAAPAVLLAATVPVEGYEGTTAAIIQIP